MSSLNNSLKHVTVFLLYYSIFGIIHYFTKYFEKNLIIGGNFCDPCYVDENRTELINKEFVHFMLSNIISTCRYGNPKKHRGISRTDANI